MSSEVEGAVAVVAVAVATPAVAAIAIAGAVAGAGWVAWKAGQGLVELNHLADRKIAEKKQELQAQANQRKQVAVSAHKQLQTVAAQLLAQVEEGEKNGSLPAQEAAQMRKELLEICHATAPADATQLEALTTKSYVVLHRIARQHQRLLEMAKAVPADNLEKSVAAIHILEKLRVGIMAMEIRATAGQDVQAADPAVLERAQLDERLVAITDKIVAALGFVNALDTQYGLSPAARTWFTSCFNGVDELVKMLCDPSTTNEQLKRGIRRLEEAFEGYMLSASGIEQDAKEKWALYEVYALVAQQLGEKVRDIHDFRDAAEIEEQLVYLQKREQKAAQCAKIYQQLGHKAYLCMALDQSLAKMGYTTHSRDSAKALLGDELPAYGEMENGQKIPFYQWTDEELAQLYALEEDGSLHVTVDENGTAYIRVIADKADEKTAKKQEKLCFRLTQELRDILFADWFISYEMEEKQSPQVVITAEMWSANERGVRVEGRTGRKGKAEQKRQQEEGDRK